jgi:hypothetical protein
MRYNTCIECKNKNQDKNHFMSTSKTTKLFILGTVAVLAIVFFSTQVFASSKPEVRKGEFFDADIRIVNGVYVSPIFDTNFEFNLVGFSWQGDEAFEACLRFYSDQEWSEWYSIESEDYIVKDGWRIGVEPILADRANKLQYKIEAANAVSQAKLIYISTKDIVTKKWNIFDWFFSSALAEESLNILSREEWEADEDWRLNSSGEELWPAEYQWPEKFVLHHTAGSDGSDDPQGTMRGVYYWHAVVLGWGDIGYNYIIDQQGNIYEGRYGGDGVIGAHVYRTATCAKQRFGGEEYEANFNPGTIGIAILGDYQATKELSETVKGALTDLIGIFAKEFEIEPDGESYFVDDIYPNIVGHRDLDCTVCPGKNLYSQLEAIRTEAQEKYEVLGGVADPVIKATYVGQSGQPVEINVEEEKEVWVEFKNDGNITWRNYKQETFSVLARNSISNFYVAGWESPTNAGTLTTPNVAPGETGRFIFSIKAPDDRLELTEEFELKFGDQTLVGTVFTISAQITGFEYAAVLDNQSIHPATFTKASQTVMLQFKNRGLQTWQRGDVKLDIYDLGENVSRYYDTSWPSQYGQMDFEEEEVKTNELATFTVIFKSPAEPGLFMNTYRLVSVDELVQEEDYSITRVDSTYQAELVGHNIPSAVLNVWRLPAIVKFKNVGISAWDRSVVLKAYDLGGAISRFKDSNWPDNSTAARLSEWSVKPGQVGTFSFRFNSPSTPGLYLNSFELFWRDNVVQGGRFSLITRVDK